MTRSPTPAPDVPSHQAEPEFRIVEDVPDAQSGEGMTPREIDDFLARPIDEEQGQ